MSRGCSTICSHPVWSVDVPIVSGPGRPYSNSLVSNWVPSTIPGGTGGNQRGISPYYEEGIPGVLSLPEGTRGGKPSGVCCTACNTAGVQREIQVRRFPPRGGKEIEREEKDGDRRKEETTTGIKYSQPQPERGLNCDQTRSRIPTAGGPTNRS